MAGYTWSYDEVSDGACNTVYGTGLYDTWDEAKTACDRARSLSEANGCETQSPSIVWEQI